MSLIAPIVRMARRLRLQAAESDLLFLEARAPVVLAEQRAHVDRLRESLRESVLDAGPTDAASIARRISKANKLGATR